MNKEAAAQPTSPLPPDSDRETGAPSPVGPVFPQAPARPSTPRATLELSPFWKRLPADDRARRLIQVRRALDVAGHVLALAITAWVFLVLNKKFFYNPIGYDEEFFVWGGWSITKGLVPYRDFIEYKPPMVFLTHALAQALFGFKDQGYRKFFTLFPLVSVLLLQLSLVGRGISRFLAMAVMIAILSLFVNPTWHDTALSDCESIGLAYYMLGLAFLLWPGRHRKWTTMLGGAFLACCVLSKEPYLPVVVATWLGLFWLRGRPEPTRESVLFFARYSLLGVAGFALLLAAYMVPTGSMKAYIAMVRGYSSMYRDPHNSYCVALGVTVPTTPMGDLQKSCDRIRSTFLNENVLGYLAVLVIPSVVFTFRRSKALFVVMVLASLGALWAAIATNCPWVHYFTMSMSGVIFILVVGFDSMKGSFNAADRTLRGAASVAVVAYIALHVSPTVEDSVKATYRRGPWHEPLPGVLAYIAQHTVPSDKILSTGPPVIYAKADRVSALRESNIMDEVLGSYPGHTDEQKLRPLYEELVRNRPKVVVFDPSYDGHRTRHKRTLLMPYLAAFHYQKISDTIYLRP